MAAFAADVLGSAADDRHDVHEVPVIRREEGTTLVASSTPRSHGTKPPKRLRLADPLPRRADAERACGIQVEY